MGLIIAALFMTSLSFATVTVEKVDCPEQFEGRVEHIIEGVGTGSAFATQKVVFKNLTTLKGDVGEEIAVEMLQNGPFEVASGEDYRVQLREGRVCWMEKI